MTIRKLSCFACHLLQSLFVEVNFQVIGGAAGGDDVQFAVGVEVGHADVLGGHLVIINEHAFPFRASLVGGVVKLDAHLAGAPGATPAGHDLVGPGPHEIAGGERVSLVEGVVDDVAVPLAFALGCRVDGKL